MKELNMRQQFTETLSNLMQKDKNVTILLGDIGVFGFRQVFTDYPNRIYNIGILEQATIGLASGLSSTGLNPVVHTIAPFLVERCYEQLKLDFGYQQLGGNFVSVGASYDYAALGCSHHCPGDIGILKNIPGMSLIVPGTAQEFDTLFKEAYNNGKSNYFRLSETTNRSDQPVSFGKGICLKKGKKGTVIVIGPMLDAVIEATKEIEVNILYFTTIYPFDKNLIKSIIDNNEKIVIVEPFYSGSITLEVLEALGDKHIQIKHIGVPRKFLSNYGSKEEHDLDLGLDAKSINKKLKKYFFDI
jgi:transketolase